MTQPVVLISAPWGSLRYPSIQLGTLKAFLNREGIPCTSSSLAVDWMKCMYAELALLATLSRQSQTVTESALLSFLRDCVERGLMYEDEGRFLSLAVGTGNLGRHRKGAAVPVPEPVHMAAPLIPA